MSNLSAPTQVLTLRRPAALRRGQSAIIALLVLLLLSFIGGLFITLIANNLRTTARSNRILNADYYAEAGIRFADYALSHSDEGADWRPPLQYKLATPPTDPIGLARYNATVTALNLQDAPANDPDKPYLDQGFARYSTDGGRYLLRITYDPKAGVNTGNRDAAHEARYLKIESVGREGVVDPKDPTTYTAPATRLNTTLVAYKPIGITDYARFETNIDKRSNLMELGVPSNFDASDGPGYSDVLGIVTPGVSDFQIPQAGPPSIHKFGLTTQIGAPDAYLPDGTPNPNAGSGMPAAGALPGGGNVRANASLRLQGVNKTYLDSIWQYTEQWEISGDLLLSNYTNTVKLDNTDATTTSYQTAALILARQGANGLQTDLVYPSNDKEFITGLPRFSTFNGLIRDGGTGRATTDSNGYPRAINRLEPPVVDAVDPATHLTRYQNITKNSQPRRDPATNANPLLTTAYAAGSAANGYGRAIYINNPDDAQPDSTNLIGGSTLQDEWLNRSASGSAGSAVKTGWVGPIYSPPGVDIVFGPQSVTYGSGGTPTTKYGFQMTRTDGTFWPNPDGTPGSSTTMTVAYDDLDASNDPASVPATAVNPNNDVILYAEGNVRLRGIVSAKPSGTLTDDTAPRHVTIVTNGTAYLDGSLLRGNPDSTITILARDYVCINTTQFLAGTTLERPQTFQQDVFSFSNTNEQLRQEFRLISPGLSQTHLALYVSAGPSESGAGGSNATSATQASFDFSSPLTGAAVTGGPGVKTFGQSGGTSSFEHQTYPITGLPAGTNQETPLWLTTRWVNNSATATSSLQVQRLAILPMDIRVEAVLYAQNRSFFVIPGPWFNSDPDDTIDRYKTNLGATPQPSELRPGVPPADVDQNRFPFYAQPIDLKIVIDGAIAEARPADISAQAAWMQKWGWIPQFHGSLIGATGQPAKEYNGAYEGLATPPTRPAPGLTIIHDPQASFPYNSQPASGSGYYLRTDLYGRPLPYTPKLPTSPALLYSGQPTGALIQ